MPTRFKLKLAKLAIPLTEFFVTVPPNVLLPGLLPMAIVTALVALVTIFPASSRRATSTVGEIDAPAVVFVGCTTNPSFVGPIMLNAELVAEVNPLDVATNVYPLPPVSIRRLPKKAIPLSGLLLVKLPERVPPAGLLPMAIVTGLVAFVTMLPN